MMDFKIILTRWLSKTNYFRFLLRQLFTRRTNKTPSVFSISSGKFDNSGLCVLNNKANNLVNKTIIVIGQERSGTSMIAGTLAKLGVYMGNTLSNTYEDPEISLCLKTGDRKKASAIIKERNQLYSTWGLKKPTGILLKRNWQKLFREPVYIIVFRDVFAIANRASISGGFDLFSGLYKALNRYHQIINFINRTKRPVLMVSYEKVLLNPGVFVQNLANFIGVDNEEQIANAVEFIEPSPKSYHIASVVHQGWRGTLENVEAANISGWAFREGDKSPVNVVLTLAEGTEIVTCANLSRLDVQQYHKHVSEFCGFQFQLVEFQYVKKGEMVSVRIEGEQYDITDSPSVY
jgi:hypothetical protein